MTRKRSVGFTLVELLVTLAIIAIAASVILPLATVVAQRQKEAELRTALIAIRTALDRYKAAADSGQIDKPTGSSGYPPNLEVLAIGVPRSAAAGINATPLVFLRRVPRDPFHPDRTVPAAQTWNVRSYGSPPDDFHPGADVFDVSSQSEQPALDGSKLKDW
ncbi:type II secretion system protein [Ramlibacter humi]|uniref:Type II secretion system protein n=1 Tax=Ramlibacter humi TaxID=2530451 RepID=A0A4Z0BB87_9BURK|nr:type II secretion system protein [Ramlibacter humi]